MHHCLNRVHISEVPKFLAESPRMTTHAVEITEHFDKAMILIIPLQLSYVMRYFDVFSPSTAEYENEDTSEIHLTVKEPPWGTSTNEYSERETCMLDHQGQISTPATVATGPVYVSTIVSYSLAYNATDVMDNENLAT